MKLYEELYEEYKKDPFLVNKYLRAGLYSISIGDKLVYIGKSTDCLKRIASHIANIQEGDRSHKYEIMRQAIDVGQPIIFDYIYSPTGTNIDDEIGIQEGVFIRRELPCLNQQIPKEDNYHKYTINHKAQTITLNEILGQNI